MGYFEFHFKILTAYSWNVYEIEICNKKIVFFLNLHQNVPLVNIMLIMAMIIVYLHIEVTIYLHVRAVVEPEGADRFT